MADSVHKTCSSCGLDKAIDEFYIRSSVGRPRATCKLCENARKTKWKQQNRSEWRAQKRVYYAQNKDIFRNQKLKYRFGLTLEQYNAMLDKQGGLCALCGKKEHRRKLAVDHCHETGKIRGLLCDKCNRGLGLFGDSLEVLKRAIEYLCGAL